MEQLAVARRLYVCDFLHSFSTIVIAHIVGMFCFFLFNRLGMGCLEMEYNASQTMQCQSLSIYVPMLADNLNRVFSLIAY